MGVSVFFLILFAGLSFFDGVYLHLFRFKLQERIDSKKEHLMHTLRSILFVPIVLMLFYWNLSGPKLWLLILILGGDLFAEGLDVLEERRSRKSLGGLPSGEYLLHVGLITTRVIGVTLALAHKPPQAWLQTMDLPPYSETIQFFVSQLVPGAVIVAILHLVLIFDPFLVSKSLAKVTQYKKTFNRRF